MKAVSAGDNGECGVRICDRAQKACERLFWRKCLINALYPVAITPEVENRYNSVRRLVAVQKSDRDNQMVGKSDCTGSPKLSIAENVLWRKKLFLHGGFSHVFISRKNCHLDRRSIVTPIKRFCDQTRF